MGHAGSIVNRVPRIGFQKGGKAAQWKDEEMAELFLNKAKQFVNDHKDAPFLSFFITDCISHTYPVFLTNVLQVSRGWDPAGMLSWKPTGVYPNF